MKIAQTISNTNKQSIEIRILHSNNILRAEPPWAPRCQRVAPCERHESLQRTADSFLGAEMKWRSSCHMQTWAALLV